MPDEPLTLEQHMAALAKEYGQYVATVPIHIDGVLAFTPGHQVPASHVDRGLVTKEQVAKSGSKAADAAPATAPTASKG